jgi:hypothetical protein
MKWEILDGYEIRYPLNTLKMTTIPQNPTVVDEALTRSRASHLVGIVTVTAVVWTIDHLKQLVLLGSSLPFSRIPYHPNRILIEASSTGRSQLHVKKNSHL